MEGSKSPTEYLVEAMEDFSRSEPREFILVWSNEENEIVVRSNTGTTGCLGLLEFAKWFVIGERVKGRE
jgi:hypothetical protein